MFYGKYLPWFTEHPPVSCFNSDPPAPRDSSCWGLPVQAACPGPRSSPTPPSTLTGSLVLCGHLVLLTSISWALSSHLPLTFPDGLGHVPSSFFQHIFVLLPYHDGEDVPPSTQGQPLLVGSQFPTSGLFTPSDFIYLTALGIFFRISSFTASV